MSRRRPGRPAGFVWNVPNALSLARLAAVPVLIACLVRGERGIFTWLFLAALLSDIADGVIARAFNLRTPIGATLDSAADLLVTLTGVAGLVVFAPDALAAHRWGLGGVIGLYVVVNLVELARYGRLASFHTRMTRVAAYATGIWMMSLLFWGDRTWLFRAMVATQVAAQVEELALVARHRRWTPDVRGLWWPR